MFGIGNFYSRVNPTNLSGAIDVVVVEGKKYKSSPVYCRFGKNKILQIKNERVVLTVNGEVADVLVKLAPTGDVYFVQEDVDIPDDLMVAEEIVCDSRRALVYNLDVCWGVFERASGNNIVEKERVCDFYRGYSRDFMYKKFDYRVFERLFRRPVVDTLPKEVDVQVLEIQKGTKGLEGCCCENSSYGRCENISHDKYENCSHMINRNGRHGSSNDCNLNSHENFSDSCISKSILISSEKVPHFECSNHSCTSQSILTEDLKMNKSTESNKTINQAGNVQSSFSHGSKKSTNSAFSDGRTHSKIEKHHILPISTIAASKFKVEAEGSIFHHCAISRSNSNQSLFQANTLKHDTSKQNPRTDCPLKPLRSSSYDNIDLNSLLQSHAIYCDCHKNKVGKVKMESGALLEKPLTNLSKVISIFQRVCNRTRSMFFTKRIPSQSSPLDRSPQKISCLTAIPPQGFSDQNPSFSKEETLIKNATPVTTSNITHSCFDRLISHILENLRVKTFILDDNYLTRSTIIQDVSQDTNDIFYKIKAKTALDYLLACKLRDLQLRLIFKHFLGPGIILKCDCNMKRTNNTLLRDIGPENILNGDSDLKTTNDNLNYYLASRNNKNCSCNMKRTNNCFNCHSTPLKTFKHSFSGLLNEARTTVAIRREDIPPRPKSTNNLLSDRSNVLLPSINTFVTDKSVSSFLPSRAPAPIGFHAEIIDKSIQGDLIAQKIENAKKGKRVDESFDLLSEMLSDSSEESQMNKDSIPGTSSLDSELYGSANKSSSHLDAFKDQQSDYAINKKYLTFCPLKIQGCLTGGVQKCDINENSSIHKNTCSHLKSYSRPFHLILDDNGRVKQPFNTLLTFICGFNDFSKRKRSQNARYYHDIASKLEIYQRERDQKDISQIEVYDNAVDKIIADNEELNQKLPKNTPHVNNYIALNLSQLDNNIPENLPQLKQKQADDSVSLEKTGSFSPSFHAFSTFPPSSKDLSICRCSQTISAEQRTCSEPRTFERSIHRCKLNNFHYHQCKNSKNKAENKKNKEGDGEKKETTNKHDEKSKKRIQEDEEDIILDELQSSSEETIFPVKKEMSIQEKTRLFEARINKMLKNKQHSRTIERYKQLRKFMKHINKTKYQNLAIQHNTFNKLLTSSKHLEFLLKNYQALFMAINGLIFPGTHSLNQKDFEEKDHLFRSIYPKGTNLFEKGSNFSHNYQKSPNTNTLITPLCDDKVPLNPFIFDNQQFKELNKSKQLTKTSKKQSNTLHQRCRVLTGCKNVRIEYSDCLYKKISSTSLHSTFEKYLIDEFEDMANLVVRITSCIQCNQQFLLPYSVFSEIFFFVRNLLFGYSRCKKTLFYDYLEAKCIKLNGAIKPRLKIRSNNLILTDSQLRRLNLKKENDATFTIKGTTQSITLKIFTYTNNDKFIISDIDGTITKSDTWGHVYAMIGRDYTHAGIAQLYSQIAKNGYNFIYLSSRPIGQTTSTKTYLNNIFQNKHILPKGPVLLSPDSVFSAIYREIIKRNPEQFKIACLKNICSLFESNPFIGGFGNKKTDIIAYKELGIPKSKIFTIDPSGKIIIESNRHLQIDYFSLSKYVEIYFPNKERKIESLFRTKKWWLR